MGACLGPGVPGGRHPALRAAALGLGLGATALALAALAARRAGRAGRGEAAREEEGLSSDPLWEDCGLTRAEVERFGRQVVLPRLGAEGQKGILKGRVLVVGAGGLGCPAALYLCAAGVGCLGIVDADTVAVSNLHRQVAHSWRGVGENKAESLRRACLAVHGASEVVAHPFFLSSVEQASELMAAYDVVVDCTDAPPIRYLLNDAALSAGRPLVAASAVGFSGQLTVYNLDGGPCLRCAFPDALVGDAAEPVASCQESGVMGPVVGTIGTLAAMEALKLLAGGALAKAALRERLLLYDALDPASPCRTTKIRRRPACAGCGREAGTQPPPLPPGCAAAVQRSDVALDHAALRARLRGGEPTVVIDVRPKAHFAVAHLSRAEHWPLPEMARCSPEAIRQRVVALTEAAGADPLVVCVCRRGNDSQAATLRLREAGIEAWNLAGGLQEFADGTEPELRAPRLT